MSMEAGASTVERTSTTDGQLQDGMRFGRYLIVHDVDGRTHAISAGAVSAICEVDDGSLLMLPGGRAILVPRDLGVMLKWLGG